MYQCSAHDHSVWQCYILLRQMHSTSEHIPRSMLVVANYRLTTTTEWILEKHVKNPKRLITKTCKQFLLQCLIGIRSVMDDRNGSHRADYRPILVAVRSNALVYGRLSVGNAHSNPAEGMDGRLLCLLCTALVAASATERKLALRNHTWCVCVWVWVWVCVCVCVCVNVSEWVSVGVSEWVI